MKNAGKARSYGLYRHLRTSKEIIENLLNYYKKHTNSLNNFNFFVTFQGVNLSYSCKEEKG